MQPLNPHGSSTLSDQEKANRTRTMQIIVFALLLGLLTFVGISIGIAAQDQPMTAEVEDFYFIMSVAFAVMSVMARIVVGAAAVKTQAPALRGQSREMQENQLWMVYQTTLIVRSALLEGPAFYATVMYMSSGNVLTLAVAGVLAFLLLLSIPTRLRIDNWVEDKLTQLELSGNRF